MKMACGDPSAAFRVAHPRSGADAHARRASVTAMAGYRRDRARGRDRGHDPADAAVGHVLAPGLAAAVGGVRARAAAPGRRRGARGDAARRALRRHGDRAVDARRRARLRQPADRPLRHRARPRARACCCPHVVRWNAEVAGDRLRGAARLAAPPRPRQRCRRDAGAPPRGLRRRRRAAVALSDAGVAASALPELAALAAQQWTGTFNPRPFDAAGALEIYRAAYLSARPRAATAHGRPADELRGSRDVRVVDCGRARIGHPPIAPELPQSAVLRPRAFAQSHRERRTSPAVPRERRRRRRRRDQRDDDHQQRRR